MKMTWYSTQKKPKESSQKLLDLINKFSKIAGYKINTQKSAAAFLYTNNEISKRESKENSHLKSGQKYVGINLTKDLMKDTHWDL